MGTGDTNLLILGIERQQLYVIRQSLNHRRKRLRRGRNSDPDEREEGIRALHVVRFGALQDIVFRAYSDEKARRQVSQPIPTEAAPMNTKANTFQAVIDGTYCSFSGSPTPRLSSAISARCTMSSICPSTSDAPP
jgi:hypothetical protein